MGISVGNKVKVLNEDFEGVIKKILPNSRLVITSTDGFDYEVSTNEVVIISEDNEHHYTIDDTTLSDKISEDSYVKEDFLRKYTSKSKYKYGRILEVDLHLEQLVEFPQKLDDWQRLHTQMQHVKNCLSAAREKNIGKIVFIHGVGTGVLKTELHNYLSKFENLTISKADFNEYGDGATEVSIKGL